MIRKLHIRFGPATLALMAAAALTACSQEGNESQSQTIDGVKFDYGLAAEAADAATPASHPDPKMHGGPPRHANSYHLTLSVTDVDSGRPIENAEALASLSGPGHPGAAAVRMEPMTVNGRRTFARYVVLPEEGPYRLRFEVRRPGEAPVSARFSLRRPG